MTFVVAASAADLLPDTPLAVVVEGRELVLVLHEGVPYALLNECSHGAVMLSEGDVVDCSLQCWLHGARFDLATGKALNPPANAPIPTYPVRIDGDLILVDVDNPLASKEN